MTPFAAGSFIGEPHHIHLPPRARALRELEIELENLDTRHAYTGSDIPFSEVMQAIQKHLPEVQTVQDFLRAWRNSLIRKELPINWEGMSLRGQFFKKFQRAQNFAGCDLTDATFSGCSLPYSTFRGATLVAARFSHTDLSGCRWDKADLTGAYFTNNILQTDFLMLGRLDRSTSFSNNASPAGPILLYSGLPSGHASVWRDMNNRWWVRVGCWAGTLDQLRSLIAQDDDWPEAEGEEIPERRKLLEPFCDLAQAHIDHWDKVLNDWALWRSSDD